MLHCLTGQSYLKGNAMSKSKFKNWKEYWDEIAGKLDADIKGRRLPDAEKYIDYALGFYSYMTEDLIEKVTKNGDIVKHTFPLMVELQDILRAILFAQRHLLLATSALHLRTSFEIRCNLNYIFQHTDPKTICERLSYFFRYEQIVGSRLSPTLPYEGEAVEKKFASEHPYWANKKSGLLRDSACWNGEDKSLKDICIDLKWEPEYFQMFKLTSKFVHGSPIVRNLYLTKTGLGCIPDTKHPTMFSLLATNNITECLMEYCKFFGIDFPETDYRSIQSEMLKVQKVLEKM